MENIEIMEQELLGVTVDLLDWIIEQSRQAQKIENAAVKMKELIYKLTLAEKDPDNILLQRQALVDYKK